VAVSPIKIEFLFQKTHNIPEMRVYSFFFAAPPSFICPL